MTTKPCECVDPGCECLGRCAELATDRLWRIDMYDWDGTLLCSSCSSDALDSGVFSTEPGEED